MDILLIGAPGSGKGTQAEKLISSKNYRHLSTGNLFRKHLKEKSPLGIKAKSYMDKGELVPDEVTTEMVGDYLQDIPPEEAIVFDGFPRNLTQAKALDQILKAAGRELKRVIFFEISDSSLVERLSGRLWAPESGLVYHIKNKPPKKPGFCDESGEALVKRTDDREEIICSRLEVFHKNTKDMLDYYLKKGLLKSVSADQPPGKLFSQIVAILEEAGEKAGEA